MSNLQEVASQSCSGESVSETATLEPKKRKSMRSAINAYCRSCGYDPLDRGAGNWRQQIGACQATACELWEFRPVSKPKKAGARETDDVEDHDEE